MDTDPGAFRLNESHFSSDPEWIAGAGWAVTRFGGVVYLSLSMWNEIYVKRVPRPLSAEAVAAARRFDRFLDSMISTPNAPDDPCAMPEILAETLLSTGVNRSLSLT